MDEPGLIRFLKDFDGLVRINLPPQPGINIVLGSRAEAETSFHGMIASLPQKGSLFPADAIRDRYFPGRSHAM